MHTRAHTHRDTHTHGMISNTHKHQPIHLVFHAALSTESQNGQVKGHPKGELTLPAASAGDPPLLPHPWQRATSCLEMFKDVEPSALPGHPLSVKAPLGTHRLLLTFCQWLTSTCAAPHVCKGVDDVFTNPHRFPTEQMPAKGGGVCFSFLIRLLIRMSAASLMSRNLSRAYDKNSTNSSICIQLLLFHRASYL